MSVNQDWNVQQTCHFLNTRSDRRGKNVVRFNVFLQWNIDVQIPEEYHLLHFRAIVQITQAQCRPLLFRIALGTNDSLGWWATLLIESNAHFSCHLWPIVWQNACVILETFHSVTSKRIVPHILLKSSPHQDQCGAAGRVLSYDPETFPSLFVCWYETVHDPRGWQVYL